MSGKSASESGHHVGDYQILEKLGKGGMSTVFKGRHVRTNEIVAIKVATRAVARDPELSRRFELEFATVHRLSHRNLVKVIECGIHNEIPFLVLEYIDGPSLAQHIGARGFLREHEAISILLPVADALTYLHGQNIIHRDVKPANILLPSKGQAKLADLGLIKDLESASQLTRPNAGLGTMQFAPPEQFSDARKADARCDVYSLAATFYTALTGENPFGKGTMTQVVERKLKNQFEAPIKKLPQLRPALDAALRMALHADPKLRPETVSDFVALLTGWKNIAADVHLPGIVAKVSPLDKIVKKAGHERRGNTRYEVEVTSDCRAVGGALAQRWESTITDISTTGLCLHVKRRFEPGSMLEIVFSIQSDESAISRVARVCWSKATDAKTWLLGCEFVTSMTDEDLESIFADLMGRTRME